MEELPTGVYERLPTDALTTQTDGLHVWTRAVDDTEAPGDLADHLSTAVQRALQDLPINERVDKANAVLELLGSTDRLVAGPSSPPPTLGGNEIVSIGSQGVGAGSTP